jgi:hypothetical protein
VYDIYHTSLHKMNDAGGRMFYLAWNNTWPLDLHMQSSPCGSCTDNGASDASRTRTSLELLSCPLHQGPQNLEIRKGTRNLKCEYQTEQSSGVQFKQFSPSLK